MESILTSIKLMLGITEADKSFDPQVKTHINSIFMELNQLGVGPKNCFSISSEMETWDNFLGESAQYLEATKTYVYLRVRLIFDPPQSSSLIAAIEREIDKLAWRLTNQVDLKTEEV